MGGIYGSGAIAGCLPMFGATRDFRQIGDDREGAGEVFLGDKALEDSATHFPDVKEKQVVRTEDGLAEIC